VLTEKARVFQSCNDYYNYEQVVKQLVEIDPEGRPDYLRQLAMSNMERGQRKEAREILARLKREQADTVSDEFEAGVLALAGMRKEALLSYRRGIARYPERIDTYLLLSNIQKELDRHDRSAGMFQYLAATAAKDDLFTIAVDGILNMRDGRANRGAPNRLVEWTRRVVLERVARRPNKLYLYRLVADLSEELNDKGMAVRALKAALPIAGEQRTQILREW
jgi:tetratricopeptide (TPR) repeat protein